MGMDIGLFLLSYYFNTKFGIIMCHSDDVFGELVRLCLGVLLASSPLSIIFFRIATGKRCLWMLSFIDSLGSTNA